METEIAGADALFQQALAYHRTGNWTQAEPLYRQVIDLNPNYPDALHLLGVLRNQTGEPAAGAELIRRAVALEPRRIEFHNSLGNALRAQGDLRGAAASFEQALEIQPRSAEVFTNLGALMEQAHNLEDAALCYLRALEINPAYGDAHFTLGNLLKGVGNFEEAVKHYEQAIHPDCEYAPEALNNLGTALRRLGRPAEAVEQFREATRLRPDFFEAHINLADALEEAGEIEQAARIYQAILSFRPDSAIAYSGAAGVLEDQGRPERATAAFRKAVELSPENALLHSNLLLSMHYDPTVISQDLFAAHQEWNRRHAQPFVEGSRPHSNSRDPERPLRIGLVSSDFRRHPVGFFVAPLIESRRPQDFQLICYSDVDLPDPLTERLAAGADLWRPTSTSADEDLAELIRQDRIDILVDLSGHTRGNRLPVFARKSAPVQITWAGYPDTTGIPAMDYLISDRWQTPPEAEPWLVEKVARMPDGYVCYAPPEYAPPVSGLPAAARGTVTFGCFNRLAKVNAEVVRLWARLMRECSGARLVLRARSLGDAGVCRRYRKMFAREGVEGSRLEFSVRPAMKMYWRVTQTWISLSIRFLTPGA